MPFSDQMPLPIAWIRPRSPMRCEFGSRANGVRCSFFIGDLSPGVDIARAWTALKRQGVFVYGSLSQYSAFCVYKVALRREVFRQETADVDLLEIREPVEHACSSFVHVQRDLTGLEVMQLALPVQAKALQKDATNRELERLCVLRQLHPFKDADQFRKLFACVQDSEICSAFGCASKEAQTVLFAYLLHGFPLDQRACLCAADPRCSTLPPCHDSAKEPCVKSRMFPVTDENEEVLCLKTLDECARVEVWGVTNITRGGAAEAIGSRLAQFTRIIRSQTVASRLTFNVVLPHAEASATVDMLESQLRRAYCQIPSNAGTEPPLVLRNATGSVQDCLVILDIFGDVQSAQQLGFLLQTHGAATASCVILVGDERLPVPLRWPSCVTQDADLWQVRAPIASLLALSRASRLGYKDAVSLPGASIFESATAQKIAFTRLNGGSSPPDWESCELRASDCLCWHERCGAPPVPACGVSQRWLNGDTPWPMRATDVEYRSKRACHVLLPNGDVARVANVDFEPGKGERRLWLRSALGEPGAQAVAMPARLAPPIRCVSLHYAAFHSAGHCAAVYA